MLFKLLPPPSTAGTPAAPRLASPLGGKDAATFTFTAVPTATEYIVTASKDGSEQTWTRCVHGSQRDNLL